MGGYSTLLKQGVRLWEDTVHCLNKVLGYGRILLKDCFQWQASVNTAINFQLPGKAESLLRDDMQSAPQK
jgi:hypothetical protein